MHKTKSFLFAFFLANIVAYADPVTVPNTFTAGTPAKASEVNANFTALANAVNANAPLMVYDSTGKLVGQYLVENRWGRQEFVFIRTPSISFAVGYGTKIESNNTLSYYWGDNGHYLGMVYYATTDCTGTAYAQYSDGFGNSESKNYAAIPPNGVTSVNYNRSVVTIFGTVPQFVAIKSIAQDNSCGLFYPPNGYSSWVIPAIGTFDLSTLNLTPPFSVH